MNGPQESVCVPQSRPQAAHRAPQEIVRPWPEVFRACFDNLDAEPLAFLPARTRHEAAERPWLWGARFGLGLFVALELVLVMSVVGDWGPGPVEGALLAGMLGCLTVGALVWCDLGRQELPRKARAESEARRIARELQELEDKITEITNQEDRLLAVAHGACAGLRERYRELELWLQRGAAHLQQARRRAETQLEQRFRDGQARAADAQLRQREQVASRIANWDRQLPRLERGATRVAERYLAEIQRRALHRGLAQFPLDKADLPGIGNKFKARLADAGIVSAADVSEDRIRAVAGFGQQRGQQVLAWRHDHELRLLPTLPHRLNAIQAAEVQKKIEARRQRIEAAKFTIQQRLAQWERQLKTHTRAARQRWEAAVDRLHARCAAKLDALQTAIRRSHAESCRPLLETAYQSWEERQVIHRRRVALQGEYLAHESHLVEIRRQLHRHPESFSAFLRKIFLFPVAK